jgi:predicted 2-oxoglutarate/Fe(II)-dependent dioxygenase YbiX
MIRYHLGCGIVLIRGLIGADEIETYDISLIEQNITPQGFTKKDGKLYTAGGYEYNEEIDSKTYPVRYAENIDSLEFTKIISEKIYQSVVDYCKVFPAVVECITEHKQLHYIKYAQNTGMGPHSDCSASYKNNSVELISSSAIDNTLSTSIVLNSDFTGGKFRFTVIDEELDLRAGDALIYPSNFVGSHEVKQITSGTRWAFLSFFSHARSHFDGQDDLDKKNLWLKKFRSDIGVEDTKVANNFQKKVEVGEL